MVAHTTRASLLPDSTSRPAAMQTSQLSLKWPGRARGALRPHRTSHAQRRCAASLAPERPHPQPLAIFPTSGRSSLTRQPRVVCNQPTRAASAQAYRLGRQTLPSPCGAPRPPVGVPPARRPRRPQGGCRPLIARTRACGSRVPSCDAPAWHQGAPISLKLRLCSRSPPALATRLHNRPDAIARRGSCWMGPAPCDRRARRPLPGASPFRRPCCC